MSTIKFKRTIRRSGGSASVAIPPEIVEALEWKIGDVVEICVENSAIKVKKAS